MSLKLKIRSTIKKLGREGAIFTFRCLHKAYSRIVKPNGSDSKIMHQQTASKLLHAGIRICIQGITTQSALTAKNEALTPSPLPRFVHASRCVFAQRIHLYT